MKLNTIVLKPIIISAVVASFVGLSIHIIMLRELSGIISDSMTHIKILKPPYPFYVNFFAYFTSILPGLGMAILYYFLRPHFKTQSRILRGLLLGGLVLLLEGQLLRQLIMNVLVGNPLSIAILQQSQIWLTHFIMGAIIVSLMPINSRQNP